MSDLPEENQHNEPIPGPSGGRCEGELENLRAGPATHSDVPQPAQPPASGAPPATAANPQNAVTKEEPNSPADASAAPKRERLANDYASFAFDGQTYKNTRVGLELTVPAELTFRPPESDRPIGTEQQIVVIIADSKPRNRFTLRKYYVIDEEIKLIMVPLAALALGERSPEGYFGYASQTVLATGFKQSDGPTTATVGDMQLLRGNFIRGKHRHTLLVAIHNDYALAFVIASNDAETAERLIKSTVLKFIQ